MSSRKLRWASIACSIVFVLSAACSLAGEGGRAEPSRSPSEVKSVKVEASPSGAIHVGIAYFRGFETQVTLSCTYPDEEGQPRQYTFVDNEEGTDRDNVRRDALDFVVKKPGQYQVTCQLENSHMSDNFTIAASAEAPSEPGPSQIGPAANPVPDGSQPPAPAQFTSGKMWFDFARATSHGPNFHLLQGCLPGLGLDDTGNWKYTDYFKVAADGTFTGECTAIGSGSAGNWKITSKLTQGQWLTGGPVTFRLETSRDGSDKDGSIHMGLVFSGAGKFISSTVASGTADWTATCQSNMAGNPCDSPADSGTIPWQIDFYP